MHSPVVRAVDRGRARGRGGLAYKDAQTTGQSRRQVSGHRQGWTGFQRVHRPVVRAVDGGRAIGRIGLGSKGAQTSGQSCRQWSGHRQGRIGFQWCTDQW